MVLAVDLPPGSCNAAKTIGMKRVFTSKIGKLASNVRFRRDCALVMWCRCFHGWGCVGGERSWEFRERVLDKGLL